MRLRFTVGGRSWELRSPPTLEQRREQRRLRQEERQRFFYGSKLPVEAEEPVAAEAAAPPRAAAAELDIDPAAQAATLREASRAGAPFCEECARLAAARGGAAS